MAASTSSTGGGNFALSETCLSISAATAAVFCNNLERESLKRFEFIEGDGVAGARERVGVCGGCNRS